jgi:hypothetical protein
VEFLTKKWAKENGYRLRKELFAFTDNKVSGRCVCASVSLERTKNHYSIPHVLIPNRSQCNSGMSITMKLDGGTDVTVLRIGLSRTMGECGRGK